VAAYFIPTHKKEGTLRRFFVPPAGWKEVIELPQEEVSHAFHVLRMKQGDQALIFDGTGREVKVRFSRLDAHTGLAVPTEAIRFTQTTLRLILGQGLPKSSKMAPILRHTTELGMTEFYPLELARSVTKSSPAKNTAKLERWERITRESAKQCRRAEVPRIHEIASLDEFLLGFETESRLRRGLLLFEDAPPDRTLDRVLEPWLHDPDPEIWVLVGPEGGLEDGEVARAVSAGFSQVTLGPRILRTETAGMAVMAILQYEWSRFTRSKPPGEDQE